MRILHLMSFGLAVWLAVGDARAQVRLDRRALDELSPPAATPAPAARPAPEVPARQRPAAAARPPHAMPARAMPPATTTAPAPTMPDAPDPPPVIAPPAAVPPAAVPAAAAPAGAVPETASAPAPLIPLAPPAPPVIPPPLAVPTRPVPPAPVVEVVADAPGEASRTADGLRITFGPGRAELNPVTAKALRDFARGLPAQASVTVSAFAPGTPEDPSASRRLSLARALAARGALIAEGVASPRILVRALGASQPAIAAGPPDRVDLAISTPSPQARPAP